MKELTQEQRDALAVLARARTPIDAHVLSGPLGVDRDKAAEIVRPLVGRGMVRKHPRSIVTKSIPYSITGYGREALR